LWWTFRRPFRPLTYRAAHRMFTPGPARCWERTGRFMIFAIPRLRSSRDPAMPLTEAQSVLGHARLSTTQKYVTPLPGDVIASVAAFHARKAAPQVMPCGGQDVLSSG
jgi:hypothetical protein